MHDSTDLKYEIRQDARDAEYSRAWDKAPESFKRQAAALGIDGAKTEKSSMAMEHNDNFINSSYEPCMSDCLDTHIDHLVERYGGDNEVLVRAIASELKKPMDAEIEKNRSLLIGRVACYLVNSPNKNLRARAHSLMHAIPILASVSGYKSMRQSAKECGVSPQWIKVGRDQWCDLLEIPVPQEGQKSDEAKEKYKEAATGDRHWRSQLFKSKPETTTTPCSTTSPQPTPQPTRPPHQRLRLPKLHLLPSP